MAATNSTTFNRFSSNIADDGAIAVFDVLPTSNINDPGVGDEYANDVVSMRGSIPWLHADTRFFEIPSSHTSKRSNAYYLNRKGTRYTEFPSVSGIPMNYGGSPLARYKALSDDIVGSEPFMLVPSFGMVHDYIDRAKSFEMWINMEPCAQAARLNILPDDLANLTLAAGTYTVSGGTATKVTDGSEWDGLSPLTETVRLSSGAKISFSSIVNFQLVGSRTYTFGIAAHGVAGSILTVDFEVSLVGGGTKVYSTDITLTGSTEWISYSFDLAIDETLSGNKTQLSIAADSIIMISDLVLSDNTGDVVETVIFEQTILEFGGINGTRVKLTADADFMYLHGYGNTANFQVGEWARPMYLVCVDNDKTFDVYIDCAPVMSITKSAVDESLGSVTGEWIVLSLSESFKYMDVSTMSVYAAALGQDIQRIHHLFGYGPKYNDVINHHPYDKIYIADGSATTFSSGILFPQTTSFGIGKPDGVTVSNQLALPDYDFPTIINGSLDDVVFSNVDTVGFGPQTFQFPADSEAVLSPRTIASDANYIFVMVSPHYPSFASGLIMRVSSEITGFNCNIVFAEVDGDTTQIDVRANVAYPFSAVTYDEYAPLYPSYASDPNYQKVTYTQAAGEAASFFTARIPRKNFLLALNIKELRNHPDRDLAAIFNDPNIKLRFNDTCLYTYIAVSTKSAALGNDIVPDPDNDLPAVSVESASDTGTVSTSVIGKATYTLYPNAGELDIAATGMWYASIPLANFATFIGGEPDLDFITYSDQGQSPQLVSSLQTDIMSYEEFQRFAESELLESIGGDAFQETFSDEFGASVEGSATYNSVQNFADAPDPDMAYSQMGIDVDTSIPTLGRFANRSIRTFVTLDSPSRWPTKDYASLEIERAGYNNYIDFENSPNSVVTTRWEIFDGFAIRIPKNINLYNYNLGLAVHMSSASLRLRKPTFRRADLFGVASGDRPSNQISVGSGNYLVVGDREDINISRPFSTHLVTETVPANYMSRELGFYPHGYSDTGEMAPVYFYLSKDDVIKGMSFYINWRGETFRTTGSYQDKIGHLKYLDALNVEHFIDIGVETISPTLTPWLANLVTSPTTNINVWVDGVNASQIEAGKWHQVYIDLTADGTIPLSDAGRSTVFAHTNEKAVLNFISSHSISVSPTNLYASRFGVADEVIFADDFSAGLHYGVADVIQMHDNASITLVHKPEILGGNGATPDATVRITLDDSSAVV